MSLLDADAIKSMYRAAGASYPRTNLSISYISISASGGVADICMTFQVLDFDNLGEAGDVLPPLDDGTKIEGVNMSVASAPEDMHRKIKYNNLRKLDFDCITCAYKLGSADVRRINRDCSSATWSFRPSWGTRLWRDGWRLPDDTIDDNGCRPGVHGLFPRPVANPPPGVDACEHIYEFCKSRMRGPNHGK